MIKVLFFIHDLSGGGAEKVLVNLVNNIDKKKFKVTVQTMFNQGINKKYLNLDIEYKYIFKKIFRGNQHFLKLFSPDFLHKKMIEKDYDIIISYMQGATTRIVGGKGKNEKVIVNWIHNEMSQKKLANSYRSYEEFVKIYENFDATVFVADSAKKTFEEKTGLRNNNIVKYNTVETSIIIQKSNEVIEDFTYDLTKINMITVGNLTYQKGYERLLRIVSKLNNDQFSFHLFILGEGILKEKLTKFIIENRLSEVVTLLGYKDNPYKYVKNADIFICSSYYEGYSTVVTESLIVGTPILTTLCSGMKEMLGENGEYGIIVENNETALYEGINNLLSNKKLLKYYKERASVRSKWFKTEKTVKEIEEFFFELIE